MSEIAFSNLERSKMIESLQTNDFDLVIIGGGVTGCGIALDAATRGLKVALVEKKDFASGTSSKSTKLIHGGLRYLKQFDIGLVRETGQERSVLNKLAPHLALPEKMLLPITEKGTFGKFAASIGLWVYDFLAGVKGIDKRKMLSKSAALKKEPLLDGKNLQAAGFYAEYRTDDARLTIELAKKATKYGAVILNYTEVVDFLEDQQVYGIIVKDAFSGQQYEIKGEKIVSAAGPWVDELRKMNNSLKGKRLHLTKGVHIVVPREKLPLNHSVYFDVQDGRMIFAIPRGKATYIGTTDTDYKGSLDRIVATKNDRDYLLKAVNDAFPDIELIAEDIESNWAGLRPLIHEDGKSPSELSRKDEVFEAPNGLISIAGGKLTGYRKMAEKIVNLVCNQLKTEDQKTFKKSQTRKIALTELPFQTNKEVSDYIDKVSTDFKQMNIDPFYAWYLVTNYGKTCYQIIEQAEKGNLSNFEINLLIAEANYCLQNEMVNTLEDFFVRRTGRLYFNIESVKKYKNEVLAFFAEKLIWNQERIQNEEKHLNELIVDATTYYDQEF